MANQTLTEETPRAVGYLSYLSRSGSVVHRCLSQLLESLEEPFEPTSKEFVGLCNAIAKREKSKNDLRRHSEEVKAFARACCLEIFVGSDDDYSF